MTIFCALSHFKFPIKFLFKGQLPRDKYGRDAKALDLQDSVFFTTPKTKTDDSIFEEEAELVKRFFENRGNGCLLSKCVKATQHSHTSLL